MGMVAPAEREEGVFIKHMGSNYITITGSGIQFRILNKFSMKYEISEVERICKQSVLQAACRCYKQPVGATSSQSVLQAASPCYK